MVSFSGPPAGATRNRPINDKLKAVLEKAGEAAGIDAIQITSGGQPGTSGGSVGSHRHDGGNAADLRLIKNGHALSFDNTTADPTVAAFLTAAAANGATGIGAGIGYMGPEVMHVGFGPAAVWGAGGKGVNTPQWLRDAVTQGWQHPGANPPAPVPQPPPPPPPATGVEPGADRYVVVAGNGAELREGPGDGFPLTSTLAVGTELTVIAFEGTNKEWAVVDLDNDQVPDGNVFSSSLAPRKTEENKDEEHNV